MKRYCSDCKYVGYTPLGKQMCGKETKRNFEGFYYFTKDTSEKNSNKDCKDFRYKWYLIWNYLFKR